MGRRGRLRELFTKHAQAKKLEHATRNLGLCWYQHTHASVEHGNGNFISPLQDGRSRLWASFRVPHLHAPQLARCSETLVAYQDRSICPAIPKTPPASPGRQTHLPAWQTNGQIGKTHALPGEPVEVVRFDDWIAVAGQEPFRRVLV